MSEKAQDAKKADVTVELTPVEKMQATLEALKAEKATAQKVLNRGRRIIKTKDTRLEKLDGRIHAAMAPAELSEEQLKKQIKAAKADVKNVKGEYRKISAEVKTAETEIGLRQDELDSVRPQSKKSKASSQRSSRMTFRKALERRDFTVTVTDDATVASLRDWEITLDKEEWVLSYKGDELHRQPYGMGSIQKVDAITA